MRLPFWRPKHDTDAVQPALPPKRRDPWDRNWVPESFRCPQCGAWGLQVTMSGVPTLKCLGHQNGQCRVISFAPQYWPDTPAEVEPAGEKEA